MKWTKVKPTEIGWYWVRHSTFKPPPAAEGRSWYRIGDGLDGKTHVVYVGSFMESGRPLVASEIPSDVFHSFMDNSAEWSGPITPPEGEA